MIAGVSRLSASNTSSSSSGVNGNRPTALPTDKTDKGGLNQFWHSRAEENRSRMESDRLLSSAMTRREDIEAQRIEIENKKNNLDILERRIVLLERRAERLTPGTTEYTNTQIKITELYRQC